MSEPLECPACGGEPRETCKVDVAFVRFTQHSRMECRCGVASPWAKSEAEMLSAWNTLPRGRWRPASEPPEVPMGLFRVNVIGLLDGEVIPVRYHCHAGWYAAEHGCRINVTHWMPLPPGPDANKVKP